MVVTLVVDGALVGDADDCTRLHLATALDGPALRSALHGTGTGALAPDGAVWLDLAVLRSRAQIAATARDWSQEDWAQEDWAQEDWAQEEWAQRWDAMIVYAERAGWLSVDGRSVRVHVEVEEGR